MTEVHNRRSTPGGTSTAVPRQADDVIRFHFAPRPGAQLRCDAGGDTHHRAHDHADQHDRPRRRRRDRAAGGGPVPRLHRARAPADDARALALHRRGRDTLAHVPRKRDVDMVRQRRGPDALRVAGAARGRAGAARDRRPRPVRLAVAEPAQRGAEGSLPAPLRHFSRRAESVHDLQRRHQRVLHRARRERCEDRAQRLHPEVAARLRVGHLGAQRQDRDGRR